jgi:hypothetical protein
VKLWHAFKQQFRRITPLEIASAELVEAEIAKLEAETAREFATAASMYNATRIERLKRYLKEHA